MQPTLNYVNKWRNSHFGERFISGTFVPKDENGNGYSPKTMEIEACGPEGRGTPYINLEIFPLGTKIEDATTHKISLSREAYNELKEKGHVGRKVRSFVSINFIVCLKAN